MNQPETTESASVEQTDLALVGVGVVVGVVCAAFGWPVVAGLIVVLSAGVPISLRDVRERIIPLRLVYLLIEVKFFNRIGGSRFKVVEALNLEEF